ncbi:hypothetical protein R1flu_018692 [Riccia fluitans]|uniref:Uncharacterized protein n=1 Tax=Riccia fluitans TaxID=41844 RepID=A0ABD1ZGK7_9MARC
MTCIYNTTLRKRNFPPILPESLARSIDRVPFCPNPNSGGSILADTAILRLHELAEQDKSKIRRKCCLEEPGLRLKWQASIRCPECDRVRRQGIGRNFAHT